MSLKWSSGYSADVAYILGFYRELAPSFLDYVCAINGVAGVPWSRGVRYCELGCGRGFGTALLAAANPDIDFVGIDFSPTHVAEAKALTDGVNLPNVSFREMSFGEASRSSDPALAEFDIIALHGVYSWVTPAVQEDIHEFIRAKLVPAGICFVSYNTMPGWAAVGPIQRLLLEVANRSSGDSLTLFSKGYEILQSLAENSSAFVVQNPTLKSRIERMKNQNQRYLAHEFLHAGWQPLYVTDVMEKLAEAKLAYIGSASVAENRLELSVPTGLQELVRTAPDLKMSELLRDYVINKHFRRDVYVKGPLELSLQQRRERLEAMMFTLINMGAEVPETLPVPAGQVTPVREGMDAILQGLADGPAKATDLIEAGKEAGIQPANIFRIFDILVHNTIIHPVRPNYETLDRAPSRRLNSAIMALTASGDTHQYLSSPVLGSAIACTYFDRLVASLFLDNTESNDQSIAEEVLRRLDASGFKLQKDGQPVDDSLEAITKLTSEFRTQRLPQWCSLGLIPASQREPMPIS